MTEEAKTTDDPQQKQAGHKQNEAQNGSTAPENTSVTLASEEVDDLRKRAGERDEYLNLLQRTQADFQNYQKRVQRDREEERKYYAGAMISDFLPVLDNLERALAAAEKVGETGPLVQGVKMVLTQFLELLKKHGVSPIIAEGQPFDPNLHEALTHQPSAEHPPNTVTHVVTTGYKIHDRVLRPAQVVVSSAPPEQ